MHYLTYIGFPVTTVMKFGCDPCEKQNLFSLVPIFHRFSFPFQLLYFELEENGGLSLALQVCALDYSFLLFLTYY